MCASLPTDAQARSAEGLANLSRRHRDNQDAIGRLGGLPPLVGLLSGGSPDVQAMAAMALCEVCGGATGHTETVRVSFDPEVIGFEELAKVFFEIHDPTQVNRQGPDVGTQYRSAVFFEGPDQEAVTRKLIAQLEASGHRVATEVSPAGVFWPAEDFHQDYLEHNPGGHMCHVRVKRFD